MSCLGGIKAKNANEVLINPSFVKKLEWCRASHKLPKGEIKVFWKRCDEGIVLNVETCGDVKYSVSGGELQKDGTLIS